MIAAELAQRGHGALVLPLTLWRYRADALPCARRELREWRRRAVAIPDPTLRAYACETLRDEHANAEGATLLALTAPPERRAAVVRLLVAYQVMYDYLDTLTEQPVAEPLATSRRLHGALAGMLGEASPVAASDRYAGYPHADDGGYLAALVAACSATLATLPSRAVVTPAVRRAIERAGESQSRNHAAMLGAVESGSLARWAAGQAAPGWAMHWWELAAAAGSSLAVHALLTAAAEPQLTPAAAARLEAAYWPWVCGLNTLLESVADRSADAVTGNHCYAARYASPEIAAERLAAIAARAAAAVRTLPDGSHHLTVLAAMACFYLAAPEAASERDTRRRVLAQLGGGTRLLGAAVRVRERLR
jgi:tetraprenyl-beta-curcumene synthase